MRWLCCFAAFAAFVFAQLPAPNAMGVTPGHLHFVVPDADAMTKAWVDLFGAVPVKSSPLSPLKIPGIYVIVNGARGGRGGEPPPKPAGTKGSVVDHIGIEVKDYDGLKAKAMAANMPWQEVTPGAQAFLTMPDDVIIEVMANKDLAVPVQFHHIHMAVADAKTATEAQAWYMKEFGAGNGSRRNLPAAMFTVGEVDFLPARGGAAPMPPAPTKGRALDHIGFDVADEDAMFKKFADDGVMVNMAARDMTQQIGLKIGFVTDPNGAYIEVTQGLKNLNDK
jgi:catechol 2,3-dioxygenase-like lactoylglutathione lyase family enzyme